MRVVMVVPSFPKLSESFIVSKFLGLLKRDWDVHVVCHYSAATEWSYFPELQRDPDLKRRVHQRWPSRPYWRVGLLAPAAFLACLLPRFEKTSRYLMRGWSKYGLDILRRFYLDADLIALDPDIIHYEFGALALGFRHLTSSLDCKSVVSFRGYDLNYSGLDNPRHYQEVWEQASALHVLGEDLWRRAQRRGCPLTKLHAAIPPAIDAQFFDPGPREHKEAAGSIDRPLRILSVGRLEWKKGYEYAIHAIKLLKDKGLHCQLDVIGDGGYIESATFARYQLGVVERVRFHGPLPRQKVRDKMKEVDVFLHSAVSEGFCNAVLEAQAMRLPVVCSDADGLGENVVDGETGFVVPRRNPEALAEKLHLLAERPLLRQQMGLSGRQRVVTKFGLSEQISAFERLYRRVIAPAEDTKEPTANHIADPLPRTSAT